MAFQEQGEQAPLSSLLAACRDEGEPAQQTVAQEQHDQYEQGYYRVHQYNEQQAGQKLKPEERVGRVLSPWLRLSFALFSVVILIPLIEGLFTGMYMGRLAILVNLIALTVTCIAMLSINLLAQRRRFSALFQRDQAGIGNAASPWQGIVLAVLSAIVLVSLTPNFFQSGIVYEPGITAEAIHFVLISKLVALGVVSLTIVAINRAFHLR